MKNFFNRPSNSAKQNNFLYRETPEPVDAVEAFNREQAERADARLAAAEEFGEARAAMAEAETAAVIAVIDAEVKGGQNQGRAKVAIEGLLDGVPTDPSGSAYRQHLLAELQATADVHGRRVNHSEFNAFMEGVQSLPTYASFMETRGEDDFFAAEDAAADADAERVAMEGRIADNDRFFTAEAEAYNTNRTQQDRAAYGEAVADARAQRLDQERTAAMIEGENEFFTAEAEAAATQEKALAAYGGGVDSLVDDMDMGTWQRFSVDAEIREATRATLGDKLSTVPDDLKITAVGQEYEQRVAADFAEISNTYATNGGDIYHHELDDIQGDIIGTIPDFAGFTAIPGTLNDGSLVAMANYNAEAGDGPYTSELMARVEAGVAEGGNTDSLIAALEGLVGVETNGDIMALRSAERSRDYASEQGAERAAADAGARIMEARIHANEFAGMGEPEVAVADSDYHTEAFGHEAGDGVGDVLLASAEEVEPYVVNLSGKEIDLRGDLVVDSSMVSRRLNMRGVDDPNSTPFKLQPGADVTFIGNQLVTGEDIGINDPNLEDMLFARVQNTIGQEGYVAAGYLKNS